MNDENKSNGKKKPFDGNSQPSAGEEYKMDGNNGKGSPFNEKPVEGKPGEVTSDFGFGNFQGPNQQTQNLDQDEQAPNLEQTVGQVSAEDVAMQAQKNVAIEETKKLMSKYMPNMNVNDYSFREQDTKKLVDSVDHLTLRILDSQDMTQKNAQERAHYEKKIVRKTKWFDFVKNYIGLNPYKMQLKSRLKKAVKVRDALDKNARIFEEELKGRGYVRKNSNFFSEMLDKLPEYVKEEKSFSSVMDYLKENSNYSAEQGGLKGVFQEVKEKGRTCKDLRAMSNANVLSYDKQMRDTKTKIDNATQKLNSEKNSSKRREHIQKRMELNGEYTLYEREKDRWQQVHDYVLDDLAGLEAEYNITNHQIQLREATISTTKEALKDLNAGIKQLENFVKTKNDVVIIGEHIVNVNYARNMANLINIGGFMYGELTTSLLGQMTNIMKGGMSGDLAGISGDAIGVINDDINNKKLERVEAFEKKLENAFY